MNDAYAEWLVKRKTPTYAFVLIPVLVIALFISAYLALVYGVVGLLIATAVFVGAYLLFRNMKVEYEYIYVTGQLSFDKILGQSKRKRIMDCDLEQIIVVAPIDSYLVKDQVNNNTKVKDFSSQMPGKRLFALVYQSGQDRTKVIFEPNDKILECLRNGAPRKVTIQ